jgi:pimeloyl-ACP methyl ester carboxylesterase
MQSFTKRDITVDGVRVQVLQAGHGAPLVYLHAAGATGGFQELLPLAEDRTLIIPIHPGFGASDDDPRIDSVVDYVLHYAALFDQLGLHAPVDLIGHSLGGWIGSLFAVFYGYRVRRLALCCPAGLRVPEHPTKDLFMIPAERFMEHMFVSPPAMPRPQDGTDPNEIKVMRYREMISLARFSWSRNYEPKLGRWLARVNVPVLLLWGEQDRIIPVQQAKYWVNYLGGPAEIATFNGAGHVLWRESAAAVARLTTFFQSDQQAQAAVLS